MKLLPPALLALTALSSPARAEDPGMALMQASLRCPAISADGKHVAIYSIDPGSETGAMTSLAVFGPGGKLEQRISIVPPATDAARAQAAAAKVGKLLDDGGYKRMSRVARPGGDPGKTAWTTQLQSEDVVIDVKLADRKLALTATRAGKKLAPLALALAAQEGRCKAVDAYGLANTQAGYAPKTHQLAFSIQASSGDTVCFGHDFVVTLE